MGLVHHLTDFLVVAFVQRIADSQHTVLLTEYELGALVVLSANFLLDFLQLLPSAVAQGLKLTLRMLGGNVFHHILTTVTTVVVG